MDVFFAILIFIAVIGITAVLFGGWVIVSVVRWLGRGMSALVGVPPNPPSPALTATAPDRARCPRARCHAENPKSARFCRRCGKAMTEAQAAATGAAGPARSAV